MDGKTRFWKETVSCFVYTTWARSNLFIDSGGETNGHRKAEELNESDSPFHPQLQIEKPSSFCKHALKKERQLVHVA
jgi:hypothetical protein